MNINVIALITIGFLIGWLICISCLLYETKEELLKITKNSNWLHKWVGDTHKIQIDVNKLIISELERKNKHECHMCNNDVCSGCNSGDSRDDDI